MESRILSAHPDVLGLNEFMASLGDAAFPGGRARRLPEAQLTELTESCAPGT